MGWFLVAAAAHAGAASSAVERRDCRSRPLPNVEPCLRAAAGVPRSAGADPELESLNRANLADWLIDAGRLDEADAELGRLAASAGRVRGKNAAYYQAMAKTVRAKYLIHRGDFAAADKLLGEVPAGQQGDSHWLIMASTVHTETGDFDRGLGECRQLTESSRKKGDRAIGFYCEARILLEHRVELPEEVDADRIRSLAAEAVRLAEPGQPALAADAHWVLAVLAQGDAATARTELKRCLAVAPTDAERMPCESALARVEAAAGRTLPGWGDTAAATSATVDPVLRSQLLGVHMRVSQATQPFAVFLRDAEKYLAEIERLRSRQATSAARLGLFSTWSDDYSWFAGVLLKEASRGDCPTCLARAFAVGERVRARTLREALAAGAGDLAGTGDVDDDLLAAVQSQLGAGEAMLAFQIAPLMDWAGDVGGGAWVVAVTRGNVRFYPLKDAGREKLRRAVVGLVAKRRDASPRRAAALYDQLLGDALAGLPRGIRHLIVVPDDHLSALPFAALGVGAGGGVGGEGGRPLVARYQISIAPSAAMWLDWRRAPSPPAAARPALVLADPTLPGLEAARVFQAAGIQAPSVRLPAARREAEQVARYLGWGCDLRVGAAASKSAVEAAEAAGGDSGAARRRRGGMAGEGAAEGTGHGATTGADDDGDDGGGLRQFAVVHFATHSVADPVDSSRSWIWLAPGTGGDGFLREADIRALRLDGRLVVLSSCSSNRGPMVRGEGVMSLARAFFLARARTVVASLWPQDDAAAAALLSLFYRHLGAGDSVAAALAAAQRDRLGEKPGLPLDSWAGFVVLGDGDLVPFPDGRWSWPDWLPPTPARLGAAAAVLVALLSLAAWAARRLLLSGRRRAAALG